MPITDPAAIAFCNERLRPLCERQRALAAEIRDTQNIWNGGVGALFNASGETVEDGRETEGVSRLTGLQVQQAYGNLTAAAAQINDEIIAHPCVRPLAAQ